MAKNATWTDEFRNWQAQAAAIMARAQRVTVMIVDDARETTRQAGLDPSIIGIHVNNALAGFASGKPWPEVNYSLARRARWLMERSFEPHRIAERVNSRSFARLMAAHTEA